MISKLKKNPPRIQLAKKELQKSSHFLNQNSNNLLPQNTKPLNKKYQHPLASSYAPSV